MAFLNVSSVLLDPDFCDSLVCRRRQQAMSATGRAIMEEMLLPFSGVVTAISPSDLDRQEDYSIMSRSISVVTKFRAQGETVGYQPDVLVWRGNNFVVKHVDPYPQFGEGFYQIEARSQDKVDGQFLPILPTDFQFSKAGNSALDCT